MSFQQLSPDSFRRWIQRNRTRLLRLALVVAVVATSIAAPMFVSRDRTILLLGLLVAIAAVWLIIHWPAIGLVALIVTVLLVPSPYLPGGLNIAQILLLLLIGLWLLEMFVNRRVRLVKSRPIRPLLALLLVACLSFAMGQLGWFSYAQGAPMEAQIGGLFVFILSVGAFLIAAHQTTSLRWLEVLTFLFIGLGALFVVGWVVKPLGNITSRSFQIGSVTNSMFWTWLVAMAFSQAAFNRKLHVGWRIVLVLVVALTVFVTYFRSGQWRSGYIPAFVAITAIVGARSWRAGLVMILLSIFPAIYLASNAVATDEYSYLTRLDAWIIMLEIIKVSPLLGFGPSNYYWYTPLFPIRGYAVNFNSHNQYIDILAQTGILGLFCFLWFGLEMAWLSLSLRNRAPEGFPQAYVFGVIGGLAGTYAAAMLADWVLPFVYNVGLIGMRGSVLAWIFLGGLVSLEQIVRRQEASDSQIAEVETVGGTL